MSKQQKKHQKSKPSSISSLPKGPNLTNEKTLHQVFHQANSSYQQGKIKFARKLCELILNSDPNFLDALNLLDITDLKLKSTNAEISRLLKDRISEKSDFKILLKLGLIYIEHERHIDAVGVLSEAISIHQGNCQLHYNRAIAYLNLKDFERAERDFSIIEEINHKNFNTYISIGNIIAKLSSDDKALPHYIKALELAPDDINYLTLVSDKLVQLGRYDEALSYLNKLISLTPNSLRLLNNTGSIYALTGRAIAACQCYTRALEIYPDDLSAICNRGNIYIILKNYSAAEEDFTKALQTSKNNYLAYFGRGNARFYQNKINEAISDFEYVIKIKPDYAMAYNNYGCAQKELNNIESSIILFEQAIYYDQTCAQAFSNRGSALRSMRKMQEAVNSIRQACKLNQLDSNAHSNLLLTLNYLENTNTEAIIEARRWDAQHAKSPGLKACAHQRPELVAQRRLRIGYVSPDLREHAVAYFMGPILTHYNKDHFEVYCYYNHPRRDAISEELSQKVDHWLDCHQMSDSEFANRVYDDKIDILVDLSGHTANNRLLSFAQKPAPVQITYLGYPGTTGLSTIDWRITDGVANPQGTETNYTEALLRLPGSLWCYGPAAGMPDVTELPALTNGHITFGSFNGFNKIDSETVYLWSQILHAVPTARLLIATVPQGEMRQKILQEFADLGIQQARIEMHDMLPKQHFWKLIQSTDITLDPVNVNGATTTCESLWLGVPVISKAGSNFLQRAGLSILSAAGMTEFAPDSNDGCVNLAQILSNDLPRLARIRVELRQKLNQSSLTNATVFTINIEKLFQQAWDQWSNGGAENEVRHRQ